MMASSANRKDKNEIVLFMMDKPDYSLIESIGVTHGSACYHYQRIKLVVSKLTSYLFDLTNNYTSISYAQTRYGSLWEKGDCAAG